MHTPAVICSSCWSQALVWEASARRGVVYSWTVVWRPPTAGFVVPYAPAIIDMAEGWQLLANVIGVEHDAVAVDQPVEIELHPMGDGMSMPYARVL